MAKTKTPFFGLGSQGSIGGTVTTQKRHQLTMVRTKPTPTYRRTLPQLYQRWLYEDYAYLWRQQTTTIKQQYATAGSHYHLTGFQYWMKIQLSLLPDIAGLWHLDIMTSATTQDFSRNGNHATIFGASPATLRVNGAALFDGINDILTVPNHASLNFGTGDYTIECFLQGTDITQFRGIVHKWIAAQPYYYFLCQNGTGFLRARLDGCQVFSTFNVLDGVLRHIACVRSGDTLSIYINGVLDNSSPGAAAISASNTGQLAIGNNANFPTTNYPLKGTLDHLILYNRALDTTELLRHSERRYPV